MSSTNEPNILLLGATGQVGHALANRLPGEVPVEAPGRDEVDLTEPDSLRQAVSELRPDIVVNAAAYTAVDEAEAEEELADAINAQAPHVLAEATAEVGGLFVHYSTDYVFDGTSTSPYTESNRPNPINVYGRSKREGEVAVLEAAGQSLVLRTSWVYSHRRSNFLLTMLRLADEREALTVVDDQTGTPTSAPWIAEATTAILRRLHEHDTSDDLSGLYHLAAAGQTSWYGFARAIFAQFGRDDVRVEPVPSEEYPTVAARPRYTVLDSSKARETFDLSIPTWTEQLAALRNRMADR